MTIIRHRESDNKPIFYFWGLLEYSDSPDRVVFLSERDCEIIMEALRPVALMQTRVTVAMPLPEYYQVCTEEQFEQFQEWISAIHGSLGGYILSNEYLERIAIALESINEKTEELVDMETIIDNIEEALGVGNAFVEIIRFLRGLLPSLTIKVDKGAILLACMEYWTWKIPLMAQLTLGVTALGGIAAAQLAEKPLSLIRTITSVFDSALNVNNRIYEFILGDWNWWDDVLKPFWNSFISDGDEGTGGDDPDNDPDGRVQVNLNQQLAVSVTMDALCCTVESVQVNPDNQSVYQEDSDWDGSPSTTPTNPDFTWDEGGGDLMKCKNAFYIVQYFVNFYGSSRWADVPSPTQPFALVEWLNGLIQSIRPIGLPRLLVVRLLGWLMGKQPNEAALAASDIAGFAEANKDDLVCVLYSSADKEDAVASFLLYWYNNYPGATVDIWLVELLIRANNTMALLWFDPNLPISVPPGYSCDCDDPCANFEILPFPTGDINAGLPMGQLESGSLDFDTTTFTLSSQPGGYAFVQGEYVRFQTPDIEDCYEISITLTGWTPQASGLSAQIAGNCSGGTQNFEYFDQGDLNSALSDICIGDCGYIVIRGGAGSEFEAEVSITGNTCP